MKVAGQPERGIGVAVASWVLRPFAHKGPGGPGDVIVKLSKQLKKSGLTPVIVVPGHKGIHKHFNNNLKIDSGKEVPLVLPPVSLRHELLPVQIGFKVHHNLPVFSLNAFGRPDFFGKRDELYESEEQNGLLKRIFFFSWAFAIFLDNYEMVKPFVKIEPPTVLPECLDALSFHDWPTGAIPNIISNIERLNRPSVFYGYDPKNNGNLWRRDINHYSGTMIGQSLYFPLSNIGLIFTDIPQELKTDRKVFDSLFFHVEDDYFLTREPLDRLLPLLEKHLTDDQVRLKFVELLRNSYDGQISLRDIGRTFSQVFFDTNPTTDEGTEESTPDINTLAARETAAHKELLGVPDLDHVVEGLNPLVYSLINESGLTSATAKRDLTYWLAGRQPELLKKIEARSTFERIMTQLQGFDREEFLRFAAAVKTFDSAKGQLSGKLALPLPVWWTEGLDPNHTERGRQAIGQILRVIIASATGRRFFSDSSPSLPTPGMHYIEELGETFIDLHVEDLQAAQNKYQTKIPLVIVMPAGDRGRHLQDFLSGKNYQGVDHRIVELPAKESFYLDEKGNLIFDDQTKELMSSSLGHGFFPAALAKYLPEYAGYHYAFVTGTRNIGASMSDEDFLRVLGRHILQKTWHPDHFFTAEISQPRDYFGDSVFPIEHNDTLRLFPGFVLPKSLAARARAARLPVYNFSSIISLDFVPVLAGSRPEIYIERELLGEETVYKLTCPLESSEVGAAPFLLPVPCNRTIAPRHVSEIPGAVKMFKEKTGK